MSKTFINYTNQKQSELNGSTVLEDNSSTQPWEKMSNFEPESSFARYQTNKTK